MMPRDLWIFAGLGFFIIKPDKELVSLYNMVLALLLDFCLLLKKILLVYWTSNA